MYDFLVVGAGAFGATAARALTDAGKRCLVIDRRGHIAGNIYTERQNGIDVHIYGAHIFHTDSKRVWDFVNRFADFNHYRHTVTANFNGEIYNLPFNMNTFNKLWGVVTPGQAKAKIAEQSAGVTAPKNLEEQAISLVGRDIYERLIKGYTEKQWGRPCAELPAFIIKRLPVRFTYDNSYFNGCCQGIPTEGFTKLVEGMLEGIDLRLRTRCTPDLAKTAKKVIYTGAIDEYFDYSLGALAYRGLRFETELLDTDNYQGCPVMNYTDAATPFTRIHEHKHFVFNHENQKDTIITREYPAPWQRGEEPYYPVNDDGNNALYARYKRLAAKERNVIFGGRLGTYRYIDLDKVIEEALLLAEALL
jgi:UDP-galactopyranose mutase